ncbi:MAG: DNA double-strand break repair nuclease NurA [Candidatus Odinarchaeia archaeon]
MLEVLYERCLKKKNKILSKIDEYQQPHDYAKKMWRETEINESDTNITIAAVDGSSNYRKFKGFVLYALAVESVIFDGGEITTLQEGEVDLLKPYKYARDRLRFYMAILELKMALKTLRTNKVDLLLFDGSILGYLIRPLPAINQQSSESREMIIDKYYPILKSKQEKGEVKINCLDVLDQVSNELEDEERTKAIMFLEYLENLLTIADLLKFKDKIIAISKTSQRNDYFKGANTPDISIFEASCKKQGYSRPKWIEVSKQVKRRFPVAELDSYFRETLYTIFYGRLADRKNVLKFESPKELTIEEIESALSNIKKISSDGYPYLLKKAHQDVVIQNRDIDMLIKMLGVYAKTGREML